MQCFICVTYMIVLCTVNPTKTREIGIGNSKRSLFHDVLQSFRIHAHLPEDVNQNEENNIAQNYVKYVLENDRQLQGYKDLMPRRNDRLEMPPMKFRYPKSLRVNKNDNKPNLKQIKTNSNMIMNNKDKYVNENSDVKGMLALQSERDSQKPQYTSLVSPKQNPLGNKDSQSESQIVVLTNDSDFGQSMNVLKTKEKKIDEDMIMCETKENNFKKNAKTDFSKIMQIVRKMLNYH
ncbi:uncharacterized protein LOC114250500 [Bombyx mandarina]|uniref:Uncharacterized protein LOC114250500 n=1 Tax=Bombyx mandarina TaxID=7092 RepID=A0A6J2KJ28_BOMMA|nr:uncharacterized protein LOC114250500 [Bombyx mandarina]